MFVYTYLCKPIDLHIMQMQRQQDKDVYCFKSYPEIVRSPVCKSNLYNCKNMSEESQKMRTQKHDPCFVELVKKLKLAKLKRLQNFRQLVLS